jgi:hypothetical protein
MSKAEYMKAYRADPANKERRRQLDSTPEARERQRAIRAKSYAKNRDHALERSRRYHEENAEKIKARRMAYYAANQEAILAKAAAYRKKNPEKILASALAYQAANPGFKAAVETDRRAQKLNATPTWSNNFFVREAYQLAALRTRMTGVSWHVDHIVPLKSKTVCGLHAHTNLQVITARENKAKHNYYWPDKP